MDRNINCSSDVQLLNSHKKEFDISENQANLWVNDWIVCNNDKMTGKFINHRMGKNSSSNQTTSEMKVGMAKRKNQRAYLIQAFEIGGIMLCYLGCILNSTKILSNFFRQSKVVSINMNTNPSLLLPSVTICNATAYKESINDFQDLERDRFLNNTFILSDILKSITFEASNREDIDDFEINAFNDSLNMQSSLSITSIYSYFKGRCYTFDIRRKVRLH